MRGRDVACAVLLLGFALVARGTWFFDHGASVAGDQLEYHALAVRLAEGKTYAGASGQPTAWRTPGLPLALSVVYRIAGPDPAWGQIALVVFSGLAAPVLYTLYLALFHDRRVALLVGAVWSFLPFSRRMAGALVCEPLAALLVALSILATVKAQRRNSVIVAALAGGAFGYAVLLRTLLLPAILGPVAWLLLHRTRKLAGAFVLVLAVLLGGWTLRNWVALGAPTLSTQTLELWQGNNAWARGASYGNLEPHIEALLRNGQTAAAAEASRSDQALQRRYLLSKYPDFNELGELERSRLFVREAIFEVLHHPGRFLWLAPRKGALFFSPTSPDLGIDWLYATMLPLFVVGGVALTRDVGERKKLLLLVAPVGLVLVGCLVVFGDPRFRLPVEPLMVVTAGFGVQWLLAGREQAGVAGA